MIERRVILEANTFSIIARCERSNQIGIAIASAIPAIGSLSIYALANIGAVATQAFINPYIGIKGLRYLKEGNNAKKAYERILSGEPVPELRQFAVLDITGKSAAFTGNKCPDFSGHLTGENYAIIGNRLASWNVLKQMKQTFITSINASLSTRLIDVLKTADLSGGDKFGKQSAALLIVEEEDYPLIDLRVDDHPDPIIELERIHDVVKKEREALTSTLPTKEYPAGKINYEQWRKNRK